MLIVGLRFLAPGAKPHWKITGPLVRHFTVTHGRALRLSVKEAKRMCVFSKPPKQQPVPVVPPPPVQPTKDDPQINEEAAAKRKRILAAKGSAANILTDPLGIADEASTGTKTLLG